MALQTVSVPKTYVQNVITCVEDAKIHVEGLVIKPLASSLGALTNEEMRIGVVSLSIGGGSTGLVLYQAGWPFKILSFPIGGDHITNDLAGVLRIPLKKADELKQRLFTEEEETLRHEGINVGLALDMICARVEELFVDHVRGVLRECDPQLFPGGVVLSGGVAGTKDKDSVCRLRSRPIREDHSLMHNDHTPYYVRVGDSWTNINYEAESAHEWMKPLVRGEETDLIELPASWYLDDLLI